MSSRKHLLLAALLAFVAAPASAADKVAATVNGKPIYEDRVSQLAATPGAPGREEVLDELVRQELVYQDALARGLDKKPEVKREIEELRKRVLMSAAVKAAVNEKPVTDQEIAAEYEKRKDQLGRKEYKARHILVNSKEKAEELIKELGRGAKFADLATKHSTDPGSKNGGDLGWFPAEQMVPPFAAAVRSLQKGEYTKSPVETQFGWHVILLEDTRDVPAPALADIKERIRAALQQQRVNDYLKKLESKAKVVKNPPGTAK